MKKIVFCTLVGLVLINNTAWANSVISVSNGTVSFTDIPAGLADTSLVGEVVKPLIPVINAKESSSNKVTSLEEVNDLTEAEMAVKYPSVAVLRDVIACDSDTDPCIGMSSRCYALCIGGNWVPVITAQSPA